MCGIIGYCGNATAAPILMEGLKRLEYRGYDSVGMVCWNNISPHVSLYKEVGKVSGLERLCVDNPIEGTMGFGHCRWATHGEVNWNNAHPHVSSDGKVLLVHNGIIENYLEVRELLQEKGFSFSSEGDTESVVNLLAYLISSDEVSLEGDESIPLHVRAMLSLRKWIKGSYALSVMFTDRPHEIYAIRCESPLVVGIGNEDLFLASDIIPLITHTKEVVYLQNHTLAVLAYHSSDEQPSSTFSCFSQEGEEIFPERTIVEEGYENVDKQGHAHFMLKEIHEQPKIFQSLYHNHVDSSTNQPQFDFDEIQNTCLQEKDRIILVSCGTSYHATMYAKYLFERYVKIPVTVEYASEFRYREPVMDQGSLIIGLSQSGETADTLAALRLAQERKVTTLGIVNVLTSSIARMTDMVLCTDCNPEIGVASTKVYTAQLLLLYYFVLHLARLKNTMSIQEVSSLIESTKQLPQYAEQLLMRKSEVQLIGRAYAGYQHMLYLGRGLLYPLALEGALKLKELSYIHAEGYAAAEMKHGPIALIDTSMPIVILAPQHDVLYEKMHSNVAEVKARGGRVLAFAHEESKDLLYNDVFQIDPLTEDLDPILFSLPLQLFSYYVALARGFDPDQPRNLAKSVTVE